MMSWRTAYVIRKMKDRDFSALEENAEEIVFLYDEHKTEFNLEEVPKDMRAFFHNFDAAKDVFVIAGPATLCVLAFSVLARWFPKINIGVYKNARYEYFQVATGSYTETYLDLPTMVEVL